MVKLETRIQLAIKEMQKSGKRSRFPIYKKIIEPLNIQPIFEDNLYS